MLCRDDHRIHCDWFSIIIEYRYLALAIRSQIGKGSIFANFLATAQAGNLWGMTLTNEDATNSGTGNWGWTAGDSYCTSESGGSCNGSTVANTNATQERVRIEITANS